MGDKTYGVLLGSGISSNSSCFKRVECHLFEYCSLEPLQIYKITLFLSEVDYNNLSSI